LEGKPMYLTNQSAFYKKSALHKIAFGLFTSWSRMSRGLSVMDSFLTPSFLFFMAIYPSI
jgi:hypothetical protein